MILTFLLAPSESQGDQDADTQALRARGSGGSSHLQREGAAVRPWSGESACQVPGGSPAGRLWPETLSEAMLILPWRAVAKQQRPQPLQGDFEEPTYRRQGTCTVGTDKGTGKE